MAGQAHFLFISLHLKTWGSRKNVCKGPYGHINLCLLVAKQSKMFCLDFYIEQYWDSNKTKHEIFWKWISRDQTVQLQPVSYKSYFRCNNCFLLLVYTINLSLSTDLVDPPPMGTFYMKHALASNEQETKHLIIWLYAKCLYA